MQDNMGNGVQDGNRNLLRDAIEALSEGFALYDEDRRLVLCNEQYKRMNQMVGDILVPGLDWEILLRETARKGAYVDAIGREDEWVFERVKDGTDVPRSFEFEQTNGKSYLASIHPIETGGFAVTATDITEKKKIEMADRDGDLLLRTVLDASSSVTVMARPGDGQVLYRTPAAFHLLGNSKSATEHYLNKEDRADFITQLLVDGEVDDYNIELLNAQGERFPASIAARLVEYKGEEVVVTSVVDRTEQIKTEAIIRRVLEACPVPVQMTMADTGRLLFSSPETTALFGSVDSAKSYYVSAEAREDYLSKLRDRGKVDEHRVELINSEGRRFWASISSRLIDFQGENVIVSNTRDLTEELSLQDEITSQREMLFQNEKMSALGELLAGVAHELNNPLSVVVGHSLMLHDDIQDPETLRRVDKISSAAERCAKIVKTFLAMARQQPTKMEHIDISSVVLTAVDVAQIGMKSHNVLVTSNNANDLPTVSVDADQITQVVINLIINAEQAILKSGTGGNIKVSTTNNPQKGTVDIFVDDDGPGIPENIRQRIFEPFFTTKDVGDGTGIGLAFCHRIILSHGGQIGLDEKLENGTRFYIRLPASTSSGQSAALVNDETALDSGNKILIVDDEIEVGELVQEILTKQGFDALFVDSAKQALEVLKREKFAAILSDMNMPGIDGREFYKILLSAYPHMIQRLGFLTGDTMGSGSQGLLSETGRPYLEKPVSPAELRGIVQELLEDRSAPKEGDHNGTK